MELEIAKEILNEPELYDLLHMSLFEELKTKRADVFKSVCERRLNEEFSVNDFEVTFEEVNGKMHVVIRRENSIISIDPSTLLT